MEYIILIDKSLKGLEAKIKEHLLMGWKLYGRVFEGEMDFNAGKMEFAQSMIRGE